MFTVETTNSTYVVHNGRVTGGSLFDGGMLFRPGSTPTRGASWQFSVCVDGYWIPVRTSEVREVRNAS